MAKKKDLTGFNSGYINVVIEKLINGNLFQEVAEFTAEQDKSDSKSLVIKNESVDFIEELDFSENELMSSLKLALDFKNDTKEQKLASIDIAIEASLKVLKNIRNGYVDKELKKKTAKATPNEEEVTDETPEKVKVNRIDEKIKLNLLQSLRQHIQDYDDRGAYEVINIRGMREIRFLVVDDLLYPLYRSPNNKTIYPNMVTKKKVYKVQADLAKQELDNNTLSKINSFFQKAMPFFVMTMVICCIFWSVTLFQKQEKIDDIIYERIKEYEQRALSAESTCFEANTLCTFYLTKFTQGNVDLLNYANNQMSMLTEEMNRSINGGPNSQVQLREKVITNLIDETKGET